MGMRVLGRLVLIVVGVVLVVLVAGYLALLRPEIPYARLGAKYANAQSWFMDLPGGLMCTTATRASRAVRLW